MRRLSRTLTLCAISFILVSASSDAKTKLTSIWLDREITIDGEPDEWRDQLTYVASADTFFGAQNDSEWLYLCLYSRSPQVTRELAEGGLRIRIESKSSGKRTIAYPHGAGDHGNSIDLWLPERRDALSVDPSGSAGIVAAVSFQGSFVYELKIPLAPQDSWTWDLGAGAGETIKMTIENPQVDESPDQQAGAPGRRNQPFSGQPNNPMGGPQSDPGWNSGGRIEESFMPSRFLFVLKSRLQLAKKR
jgi:hypothetical protein